MYCPVRWRSSLKSEALKFSEKSAHSPFYESPLRFSDILCSNWLLTSSSGFSFIQNKNWQSPMKNCGIGSKWQSELFLFSSFIFQKGKAKMNALHLWNCGKTVSQALAIQSKRYHIVPSIKTTDLVPPLTKAQWTFISAIPIHFQIANQKIRWCTKTLKGSHRMGGGGGGKNYKEKTPPPH